MPIAVGIAVVLGFLSLAKTKRPIYYTVEEGDDLCTIGECFNQDYLRVYDKNRSIISDPHLIYPGDRYHSNLLKHPYDQLPLHVYMYWDLPVRHNCMAADTSLRSSAGLESRPTHQHVRRACT